MAQGLASVAKQLQSYGRGPDTMLAHISPDEAKLIDYMQGGRKTNPATGLPEYGLFGKILKGLARAAGAIGGFMVGGPAGAALGAGAATKLTGGSWKDAGLGALLGGVGAGAGNMLAGQGFMGAGNAAGVASLAGSVPSTGLAAGSTAGLGTLGSIGAFAAPIGGLGGVGAGLGGLMAEPRDRLPAQDMTPPVLDPGISYNPNQPVQRQYVPYEGDYSKYGEMGGGHSFFRPIEPVPLNVPGLSLGDNHPDEPIEYARGGRARGYAEGGKAGMDARFKAMAPAEQKIYGVEVDPGVYAWIDEMGNMRESSGGRLPSGVSIAVPSSDFDEIERNNFIELMLLGKGFTPEEAEKMARNRKARGGRAHRAVKRASAAARAGRIHGPSDGSGMDDQVPAMLTAGEHVVDKETVDIIGDGNNDRGHKRIEATKRRLRKSAGVPAPYKSAAERAKKRAGVR